MEVLLLLIFSISNIACFCIGAKVGQKVSKDEPIELPKINPMETIRDIMAQKEAKREQDRVDTIMRNIEMYNGTSESQEDVPKG